MLMVWFVGPAQLPLFFQRLVGLVNALLAMLVVVFAIREYGKKYNRLRWPVFGRVSTSKVAGSLAFIAVAAWWLSPWAPIPPGAGRAGHVALAGAWTGRRGALAFRSRLCNDSRAGSFRSGAAGGDTDLRRKPAVRPRSRSHRRRAI